MKPGPVRPGDVVTIMAFDDVPEHLFLVDEVLEDFVTGFAVTGDLAGEYGEPALVMVLRKPSKSKKEIRKWRNNSALGPLPQRSTHVC